MKLYEQFNAILSNILAYLQSLSSDLKEIKASTESIDKAAKAQQQDRHSPTEVVAEVHEPTAVVTKRNKSDTRKERRDRWRLVVEWLTLFAVVLYGYVAIRQWKEMIQARHQVERAAEEARLNRLQAKQSLDDTIRQFHLDQRAWVGPIEIGGFTIKANSIAEIRVKIKNSGKTPALRMQSDFTLKDHVVGTPLEFIYSKPSNTIRSIDTLQPGMEMTFPASSGSALITEAQIDAFKTGLHILFAYGQITYNDVFSVQHRTTFCFYVAPNLMAIDSCDRYNTAD